MGKQMFFTKDKCAFMRIDGRYDIFVTKSF